jgi:HD-GYP domain-containing protein (c-di-GMP phosphodiesterase class II)
LDLNLAGEKSETSFVESILNHDVETGDKLLSISSHIDQFEGYEQAQGQRVAAIADSLAVVFNLASRDRFFLQQASLIHDIGEMLMNRDYIRAPRGLSIDERFDLQRHPVIGEQEAARLGLSRAVQLIVRWHHEWWNGSGYPDGLEGEQIPLAARILRVADTYASLTTDRPYRVANDPDGANKYLIEWAGIEFDPDVVIAFVRAQRSDLAGTASAIIAAA